MAAVQLKQRETIERTVIKDLRTDLVIATVSSYYRFSWNLYSNNDSVWLPRVAYSSVALFNKITELIYGTILKMPLHRNCYIIFNSLSGMECTSK